MDNGLVFLITDDDAMEMVSKYKEQAEINVYVEHPIDTPNVVDNEVEVEENDVEVNIDYEVGNEPEIRSGGDESEEVFLASSDDDSVLGGGVEYLTDSSSEDYDSAKDEAYRIDPHEMKYYWEDEYSCLGNGGIDEGKGKGPTENEGIEKGMGEGLVENEGKGKRPIKNEGNDRPKSKTIHGEGSSRVLIGDDGIYINSYEDKDYLIEELHTPQGSEDEGNDRTRWPQFNPNVSYGHARFELSMEFANLDQFKLVVRDYAIHEVKDVIFTKK
ncbi:hypothetical protein L6164_005714 [Bauhinia variegata]|uniref:Uncharacterized protein n=1 Tax=Bauhinia variegata TaxID=167791 RepID=A0ACB9PTL1_BAUVA|nr:hypothetical protein L6164_005714 [Bauhinia variegata]